MFSPDEFLDDDGTGIDDDFPMMPPPGPLSAVGDQAMGSEIPLANPRYPPALNSSPL